MPRETRSLAHLVEPVNPTRPSLVPLVHLPQLENGFKIPITCVLMARNIEQNGELHLRYAARFSNRRRLTYLQGYIRGIFLQKLNRGGPKDPLPHGPPPEVAAPTSTSFHIKWDESEKSLFNRTAGKIVVDQVYKDWPNLLTFNDHDEIVEMAELHIKYLRWLYRQQTNPAAEAREKERRRRSKAAALTRKRTVSFDMIRQCSLLIYPPVFKLKLYEHRLRVINAIPGLKRHGRLMETLGIDGTSSDEEDPNNPGVYFIKRQMQLAGAVNHLKGCVCLIVPLRSPASNCTIVRQIDHVFSLKFKGAGTRGAQCRRRQDAGILSTRDFTITGLPYDCVNSAWVAKLTKEQKELFEFRNVAYNFVFPVELLEGGGLGSSRS